MEHPEQTFDFKYGPNPFRAINFHFVLFVFNVKSLLGHFQNLWSRLKQMSSIYCIRLFTVIQRTQISTQTGLILQSQTADPVI